MATDRLMRIKENPQTKAKAKRINQSFRVGRLVLGCDKGKKFDELCGGIQVAQIPIDRGLALFEQYFVGF